MDVPEIADRLASGGEATDEEIAALITAGGDDREAVFAAARRVRDKEFGKRTYLYGFVYFSTYCRNECSFCYYRNSNGIDRYRKSKDEIVDLARSISDAGINLADLTMGEDPYMIRDGYANFLDLVSTIRDEVGIPIMASPGAVPRDGFPRLAEAGADIMACYQETYNRRLFAERRLGQDFDHRRNQKVWAMENGMLAEDGMMVGIGETVMDRVHAIREMVALGCDQVRAMTFVPQDGTPMQDSGTVDTVNELLCLSAMRLLRQDAVIPAPLDVEGIAGMETRLNAGASTVTSIIPASSHLAGVAQSSMDIEEGHRCADYVIARLKAMGREPATAADLRREFDRRKARLRCVLRTFFNPAHLRSSGVVATSEKVSVAGTRRQIIEVFWKQAVESGNRSVSVKSIMAEVGMNRTTFYDNFESIDELIRVSEDVMIEELLEEVSKIDREVDADGVFEAITWMLPRYGRRAAILLSSNGDPEFLDRIRATIAPAIFRVVGVGGTEEDRNRIALFVTSALAGVMTRSLSEGWDDERTRDEFFAMQKLVYHGVAPFAERDPFADERGARISNK